MITINNDPFQEYQKDFAYCESIIKKNSKSFYLAFSQLPKRKAQSVYAVYAFCRRADDLIDRDNNQAGLRQLERQLLDFNEGKVPNDPVWRALSVVFDNFPMVTAPFFDMLTGQRKDADFKQPETRKDLEEYCYYVAGSVGLMLLPLLTERPADIVVPAKKLGEAMQLTNILRDVGEDYQMGRIYLTKEDMTRFGVATTMLKEKQAQKQLVALWESLAQQAETLYEESFEMFPLITEDCRQALASAAFIYREQLNIVRKQHYSLFDNKNKVSHYRKVQLLKEVKSYLKSY
ncbi:phytoene/squalene synthase family protein [Enterococcus hirae]|uniref:phytoene/squalene synthase family protein n=1 Tax=Enterococcus hirae TaxID=1354 RepID=UPI0013624A0E|nr:phytoene/squalene synthase family protein [Enterococcus hirae]EMF0107412.1 phytoene/squalene synthase family protein [Enterococcus hirae]EMF0117692.1 phytoene/squalene synthase family protein [Enterococcus hirae]EMF0122517.1 phytoene/squalene synthase family protein [Enterococcus hirae]EMF0140838.1 phytoene/squalene synthase family protein [Enterococcus hirae]EMF0164291.1 phytoene/squalene synthase family protein [Enterococcus hirae]